ncbi:methionyl-tRNA synthetase [Rhodotorula mucilaginosa]|uniref:Methionyl-tRNA synthetase n=1 Tax=Rhodotorula mucilaginosa TaxID=5537 RepID=A0A9P7B7T8_RHOMI|nr:methionyl-tRNA synthetase [Rhodotorula mucilaginosa]
MIGGDVSPAEINSAPAEIRFARLLLRSYAFQYSTDRPHSAPEQSSVTSPTPAELPATSSTHAVLAGLPPSKSRLYRSDALERSDHAGDGPDRPAAVPPLACSAERAAHHGARCDPAILTYIRISTELTFIVHSRRTAAPSPNNDPTAFLSAHDDSSTMLGDVNLFLHEADPETDPEDDGLRRSEPETATPTPRRPPRPPRAEMEIMFPPTPSFPARSGIATHTLQVFLSYAATELRIPPRSFFARIGFDNEKSLGLFRKLGFVEGKRVEVFREVELVWPGENDTTWPWEREPGWKYDVLTDPRNEERD